MGASEWSYFVTYEADIGAALQRLRHKVFREGLFHRRDWDPRKVKLSDLMPPDPYLTPDDIKSIERNLAEIHALEDPSTVEKLVEWNREDGTHSILDITRVRTESNSAGFGEAVPLSEPELVTLFGTARTRREAVEGRELALIRKRKRWSCVYVVVFDGGRPSEICFAGASGD